MNKGHSSESINIIIADDKVRWVRTLKLALEENNIVTLAEAKNGLELLKLLETTIPHIILLDLNMPAMDGNETMDHLTKSHPNIKVIIMSFLDDRILMEDYLRRGAKAFYVKYDAAGNIKEFADVIKSVHKGGKYMNFNGELVAEFTSRQKQIISLMSDGKSIKQISKELALTTRAIDKQKKKIMQAVGVKNQAELYKYIFDLGLNYLERPKAV